MQRSTERFLTTHTGSLPRADDLVRMMYAKEEGVPVERAALGERIKRAVAEVVEKQVVAGIDLVNDRVSRAPATEQANYVLNRLRERGILAGTDGPHHNVIKLRPPLVFTDADAALFTATLDSILDEDPAQPLSDS